MGRVNRAQLLEDEGVSRPTLGKKFSLFLSKPFPLEKLWQVLPPMCMRSDVPWVLGIDGKWLRRNGVVMIYRDVTRGENLYWSFWSSESYQALHTDLLKLTELLGDHLPVGVISDWKGSIVSGVSIHLPGIPHQRCLVHVVRDAKRFLPKRSPMIATRKLRTIARHLTKIENKKERTEWTKTLIKWEKIFGYLLSEKTTNHNPRVSKKWWYTHGNLRRGWSLLTHDWDPFFVHLDHPIIPSSNNSLEGTNSQIKKNLTNHRGMKTLQQVSFLFWYLTFTRTKNKQTLRKIWDGWRRLHNS